MERSGDDYPEFLKANEVRGQTVRGVDRAGKNIRYWRDFWIAYFKQTGAALRSYSVLGETPVLSPCKWSTIVPQHGWLHPTSRPGGGYFSIGATATGSRQ